MQTTPALPPALYTIVRRLNFRYHGPVITGRFETFTVDLSDWNLSLTDANPCVWVKAGDLATLTSPELADSLKDVVRERGWQNSTVLLLVDGDVELLRPHLPAALPTFVTLNAGQQAQIQAAASPTAVTLDILLCQMPRSQLAPYETNKPVVGSQFFGRHSEINKVLRHPHTSYLFVGIRRIGKTSLLKEIKRRMDRYDPPAVSQTRRLYVDCTVISSAEEFLRTLTLQLDPSEMKLLMGRAAESQRYQRLMFDRFASLHGEPVTFLIDELDRLLLHLNQEWNLFDVLGAAANAGKARFIMAGFRQAMAASTNEHSPLFDLVAPIRLGRLQRSDVTYMVLTPLERLRIEVHNRDAVVNRIIRETAGLPNYVQFYCKTLLEQLDEQGRDILTEDDLRFVYENGNFRDFVLDTFTSNTEVLERALVYALVADTDAPAGKGGSETTPITQRAMDEALKSRKLPLRYEQLDRTCRNLEIAGVFNQVGKDFEFAVPLFQSMLRQTRDIDFLFEKAREEILAEKIVL